MAAPEAEARAIKTGILFKRSDFWHMWHERWVEINPGGLKYWKSEADRRGGQAARGATRLPPGSEASYEGAAGDRYLFAVRNSGKPSASDTVFAATSEQERQSWHAAIREAANEVHKTATMGLADLRSPDSYRSVEAAVTGSPEDTPYVATSGLGDRVLSGEGMDSWVQVSSRGSPQRWDGSRASDALVAAGSDGDVATPAAIAALSDPTDAIAPSANAVDAVDSSAAPLSAGVVAAGSISATAPNTLPPSETTSSPVAAADPGTTTEPPSVSEPVSSPNADFAVRPEDFQPAALLGGMVSDDNSGAVASPVLPTLSDVRAGTAAAAAAADSAASNHSNEVAQDDLVNSSMTLGPEDSANVEALPVSASPSTTAIQTLSGEDGQGLSHTTAANGGDAVANAEADDTQAAPAPVDIPTVETEVERAVAPSSPKTPKIMLEAPEMPASSSPRMASFHHGSDEGHDIAARVEPAAAAESGHVVASDAGDIGAAASAQLMPQSNVRPSPSQAADATSLRSPDLAHSSTKSGIAAHDELAAPLFARKPESDVHSHATPGFATEGYQLWDTALLAALFAIGLATIYSSLR